MKINLQPLISPSPPMTALIYVAFFGAWMGFYWLYDFPLTMHGFAGNYAETLLPSNSLLANLLTFSIVALNSMIIAQMNNKYAIIRTRTFMPTFIYLLLSTCWLPAYGNYVAALAALFALVAVYFSLEMYKNKKAVEHAFLSFFALAVGSFLVPEFAVLVFAFWIGFALLNCFSSKVFFASVFGFITPWILFFAIHWFFVGQTFVMTDMQAFVMKYTLFDYENIPAFVYVGVMLFVLVTSLVQMTANDRQDSIQTRNVLNFFKVLTLTLALLFLFRYSGFTTYLPFTGILFAMLSAYIFTLLKNLFNSIVFIVLCAANLAFAFYLIIL